MEIETCIKDAKANLSGKNLVIENSDGMLSISTSRIGGGVKLARWIINYNLDDASYPGSLDDLEKELGDKYNPNQITVLPLNGIYKIINLTDQGVTVIITASKTLNLNYIVLVDACLYESSLMNIFKGVLESKVQLLNDLKIKRQDYLVDEVVVACRRGNKPLDQSKTSKINSDVIKNAEEAFYKLFKNMGYPKDILGHINEAGVTIEQLVIAGMELVVGVEITDELKLKLKNQILKSLEDLNVASLIMAGIRLEEDLLVGRIRGIDVADDPAYLYSDEVLGMAVANQIAGTKAIFNFKRYDEEKPGILGKLGPVLDDIFAGLVAGCMSRIFEE